MNKQSITNFTKGRGLKNLFLFLVLFILLLALFFLSVNTGSIKLDFVQLFKGLFIEYNADVATVVNLRFPRIIISVMAGASLAVAGALFQAVLKNPLADPGILGISGGAAFLLL